MSRSTISTFQLFAMYPDEESARLYLEGRIWPIWSCAAPALPSTLKSIPTKCRRPEGVSE
jgi:hypothetical protein